MLQKMVCQLSIEVTISRPTELFRCRKEKSYLDLSFDRYPGLRGANEFFRRVSEEIRECLASSHLLFHEESSSFLIRCQGDCSTCGGKADASLKELSVILSPLADLLSAKEICISRGLAEMPTGSNFVPSIFHREEGGKSSTAKDNGDDDNLITLLDD